MVVLMRPSWVRGPSGKRLKEYTESALVDEICAAGVPGLTRDMPSDKLILGWFQHLCRVVEESGQPPEAAVDAYLGEMRP